MVLSDDLRAAIKEAIEALDAYADMSDFSTLPEPPPDAVDPILPRHDVHNAICAVEALLPKGKLPLPERELWGKLVNRSRRKLPAAYRYATKLQKALTGWLAEQPQPDVIPLRYRTVPMSYARAAQKLWGCKKSEVKKLAKRLAKMAADGADSMPCIHSPGGQRHIFDVRKFPAVVRAEIAPQLKKTEPNRANLSRTGPG